MVVVMANQRMLFSE